MRIRIVAGLVAALAGVVTFTASPASAGASSGAQGAHCVVNLDTGKVACDDTEQQARQLADVGVLAVNAVKLYDRKNFDPDAGTFTITTTRSCTSAYEHEYSYNMAGGAWNNRASSVETFNSCDVKLYDAAGPPSDPNLTGGSTWIDRAADLSAIGGGWNNRASSLRIS
ncbi:hypothetical protein GCM10022225_20650 [Plantactinospora mayteni]|uniref:Uncharacterized protein n=1 Tax=Plantactinospora mayteni TaxID=566021 RepID=A0ABQ4ENK8_9ACTN|nr:hypothetical protein [Plantactinospora mayteni]GIG96246.1 hypothetical protein Pma05_28190 [Plantactinospora mayteni]